MTSGAGGTRYVAEARSTATGMATMVTGGVTVAEVSGRGFDPTPPAPGPFGGWELDPEGKPAFALVVPETDGSQDDPVIPPAGAADVWHLVGSPGLLATAHGSGRTSIYLTASGMDRLVDRGGRWQVDGVEPSMLTTRFGCGWVEWCADMAGASVIRRIESHPTEARLTVRWTVTAHQPVRLSEIWEVEHLPIVGSPLMSRPIPVPSTHRGWRRIAWPALFALTGTTRALTDLIRRGIGRRRCFEAIPEPETNAVRWRPRRSKRTRRRPTLVRRDLPTLVLRTQNVPPTADIRVEDSGIEFTVDPSLHGSPAIVDLELAAEGDIPSPPTPVDPYQAVLDPERAGWLAHEAVWHLDQLRGLRVPDAWTGRTFVMQGSAYAFVHGLHGAPRDSAFVAVVLAVLDPPTARDVVMHLGSMIRPDGSLHYAHTGYGVAVSGGVHASPTDLPLFLLWAVTEYVWATGDHSVLNEVPCPLGRSRGAPASPTLGELVVASSRWFRESVGTGPHGLVRVGSGDWSDPISLMVTRRRDFHRSGESTFNTGMARYVLPRAAVVLDDLAPREADRVRSLAGALEGPLNDAWNGKWYLRGWDGRGEPIGADHCFLDAQLWPIIADHGTLERQRTGLDSIARLLDDPSPIGPTILDRPHEVRMGLLADGWDCNGGVWAALGGLTAWAYSLHDISRARSTLTRQSLAAHSVAYPNVWFGHWSGPDAYNAWFGDKPGETFVHPATPMAEFPVMNSNAHAGPLLGLLRTLGVTVGPDGVKLLTRSDPDPHVW